MMQLLTSVFVTTLLVCCTNGHLLSLLRLGRTPTPRHDFPLCPGHPLPVVDTSDVLAGLRLTLDEAAKNISAILKEDKAPGGAVVGVVYRDMLIWSQGFGLINDSEPSRGVPDADTAFRIGSITKVFTALMMLQLRDAGLLPSLDEDITKYLPEFKIQNPFRTKRAITFRQLSSHMSGLPRETPCPDIFIRGCNLTYAEIYDNLAKLALMSPPGLKPSYSNLGFAALGRTLEKIQGPNWEDQVQQQVLKPLGMTHSGNSFTPEVLEYLAVGYTPDGTAAKLIDIGFEAPAGQMYASTKDLAQLMKLLFRPEEPYDPDKGQILDGETIREWMEPAYTYFDGTGFGHPWELLRLSNYTLRTKSGEINGYASQFQMAHEIKTGFIFLQSCDTCTSSNAKIIEIGWQIIVETSRILWALQPGPRIPPQPSDYTGVYNGEVMPSVKVTANITFGSIAGHQALWGYLGQGAQSITVILEWTEGDSFQLTTQGIPVPCFVNGGGEIGERVYFERSGGGKVTGLTVPGLTYGTFFKKEM